MRMFELVRHHDVSGVSGTGIVAEGVVWTDGAVALRWYGEHPSTAVWSSLDDLLAVHGHAGETWVHWVGVSVTPPPSPKQLAAWILAEERALDAADNEAGD